jgi:acetolactate synthase regulatory subunit
MSFTLHVRMKRAESALVRLLGQISRRGYEVLAVTARLAPGQDAFEVEVEFQPNAPLGAFKPRPPEVLPALVAKLCEVESVELRASVVPRGAPEPSGNGSASEAPRKAAKPAGEGA